MAKIASRSGSAPGLRCSPGTTRTRKIDSESNADFADTKIASRSRNTYRDSDEVHHEVGLLGVVYGVEYTANVDAYDASPHRVAAATNVVHREKTYRAHVSYVEVSLHSCPRHYHFRHYHCLPWVLDLLLRLLKFGLETAILGCFLIEFILQDLQQGRLQHQGLHTLVIRHTWLSHVDELVHKVDEFCRW